jgi:hypothetical protein
MTPAPVGARPPTPLPPTHTPLPATATAPHGADDDAPLPAPGPRVALWVALGLAVVGLGVGALVFFSRGDAPAPTTPDSPALAAAQPTADSPAALAPPDAAPPDATPPDAAPPPDAAITSFALRLDVRYDKAPARPRPTIKVNGTTVTSGSFLATPGEALRVEVSEPGYAPLKRTITADPATRALELPLRRRVTRPASDAAEPWLPR